MPFTIGNCFVGTVLNLLAVDDEVAVIDDEAVDAILPFDGIFIMPPQPPLILLIFCSCNILARCIRINLFGGD